MKVYAVFNNDWEDGVTREIFATRELAEAYCEACPQKKREASREASQYWEKRRAFKYVGGPDPGDPPVQHYYPEYPEIKEFELLTELPW